MNLWTRPHVLRTVGVLLCMLISWMESLCHTTVSVSCLLAALACHLPSLRHCICVAHDLYFIASASCCFLCSCSCCWSGVVGVLFLLVVLFLLAVLHHLQQTTPPTNAQAPTPTTNTKAFCLPRNLENFGPFFLRRSRADCSHD